jgi:single-strand DNA-binding protein
MSLNKVQLIGRMARDPEHRVTQTGKSLATFAIAVRKRIKPTDPNERDADFFNVKAWGTTADYAKNYLNKGRLIAVDGRIETRKYTDQNGINREIWEVVADNIYALDGPKDDSAAGADAGSRPAARPGPAPREEEYDPFADE